MISLSNISMMIQEQFNVDQLKATELLEIYKLSLNDNEIINLINEGFSPIPIDGLGVLL